MEEKSTLHHVVFTRKAKDRDVLTQRTWAERVPCRAVVERVIELPPERYRAFAQNLLDDYDFLREHQNCMSIDNDGVWHCLLVKAEGARDGILVNAEGASYARYSAYCPDTRPFEPSREPKRVEEPAKRPGETIHTQETHERRLFLVSYDFLESGHASRCGFLCEATSIRSAAEAFWNQHPGKEFSLRTVTDGRLEAFWVKERGQFVTVPGREEEAGKTASLFEEILRTLQRERQAEHQRDRSTPTTHRPQRGKAQGMEK